MAFFSIILPTYNRAHFLPKAIQSVLGQTFEDWELVIIDDGSTDSTAELVRSYKDPRIRYIYQQNQERSAARNNGINHAQGDYICFLDSDDYYLPEKLNTFFEELKKVISRKVILYDGLIFEDNQKRTRSSIPIRERDQTIFEFLLLNPIGPLQVCIPRELLIQNGFNPVLRIGEDVELWLRLAVTSDFIPVNSFYTVALVHEDRSVNLKKVNAAKEQLNTLQLIFSSSVRSKINPECQRRVYSNCLFNVSKYYMYNGRPRKALNFVVRALLKNSKNEQTKHRLYCLIHLFLNRIPSEYKYEKN
jgi:glycosyltransferase involved in cell wall biosynthesis